MPLALISASRCTREEAAGKESMLAMRLVFSCSRSYSSRLRSSTGLAGGMARAASTAREASACISSGAGGFFSPLEMVYSRARAYAWKRWLPATLKICASCEIGRAHV